MSASGTLRRGLCSSWRSSNMRVWRFRCADASAVARAVPFGRAVARGKVVRVVLPFRWLRFPYVLASAQAAVPGTRGPFAVERVSRGMLVARRRRMRLVFRQVEPARAAVLFRRGELDEAQIPLGDIRASQRDAVVARTVRVTQLRAVDAVVFDPRGALASFPGIRRAYWQTAQRADYQSLVAEEQADAAVSLVPGYSPRRTPARAYRAARAAIPSLPIVHPRIGAAPGLDYGRDLLVAAWRDATLPARRGGHDGTLVRVTAWYPQDEAILVGLLLRRELPGRGAVLRALGERDEGGDLRRADDALFDSAAVIPIAWAVDARFVSPRLRGWREDTLGVPDYARVGVRSRATTRRR